MEITLIETKDIIDIEGRDFHKYWSPQRLHNGTNVFIMQEEVDKEYEGYAVCYLDSLGEQDWTFFWHDTILKHGVLTEVSGKFNNKPFYGINIAQQDGHSRKIN